MKNTEKSMDTLVNLCKNRGFVYAGSEIYGGLANTWDYGPLGVELKNNIKRAWWKKFIQENPYNVGQDAAILMNLSTYFLCYWLFSSALTTLLDRFYITKRRLRTHICLWILFSILSGIVLLLLPKGGLQTTVMFALAAWLVIYGLFLTRRLLRAYHRVIRIFDDTRADDIGAYIK